MRMKNNCYLQLRWLTYYSKFVFCGQQCPKSHSLNKMPFSPQCLGTPVMKLIIRLNWTFPAVNLSFSPCEKTKAICSEPNASALIHLMSFQRITLNENTTPVHPINTVTSVPGGTWDTLCLGQDVGGGRTSRAAVFISQLTQALCGTYCGFNERWGEDAVS